MITVINNFNESTEMYEGMSLADASAQFMLEANQLVNDFMMDLLMTEHQYLFDHGEQLDWTQEAADGGLGFADKVGNLVNNAKNLFLKIVNNIIAFVQEKTSQVINWFKKIGLTKSNIRSAFTKNGNEDVEVIDAIVNYDSFINSVEASYTAAFASSSNIESKDDDKMITSAGEFLEHFDKSFNERSVKASQVPVDNVISIIFNSDKIVKSAKKAYKKATDSLEQAKRKVASKKTMDASDIKDKLEKLRAGVLNNTYVMRDLVKIYGNLVREAINVAKDLVKVQKDKDKDDKKKENENTAKEEPKNEAPAKETTEKINGKDVKVVSKGKSSSNPSQTDVENESADLDLAVDYLQGCLEGTYEIDNELLEACVEVVNENTDTLTVDDYNTVMESVEKLQESIKANKFAGLRKFLNED